MTPEQKYRALYAQANALNEALTKMHLSQAYQNVFRHYRDHGLQYQGPTYFEELRALRVILHDHPPEPETPKESEIPLIDAEG